MEPAEKNGNLKKYDDTKIITALVCLFIGFLLIWNIAAHVTPVYELRLDKETCSQVKTLGLTPSDDCMITAPYRPFGITPGGYLISPAGKEIQIVPVAANQTNRNTEWTTWMRLQFWTALLFWGATLVLLASAFFPIRKDAG